MIDLHALITDQIAELKGNQFFHGGFILGVLGAIAAIFRQVPHKIWGLFLRYILTTVEFTSQDDFYVWFSLWLNKQTFIKDKNRLRIQTKVHRDGDHGPRFGGGADQQRKIDVIYTLGNGTHIVRFGSLFMRATKEKEPQTQGSAHGNMAARDMFVLTILSFQRRRLERLITSISDEFQKEHTNKTTILHFNVGYDEWVPLSVQSKRDISCVVLKEGQMEEILIDYENFQKDKPLYDSLGIPYQRGYLLQGPPGTGKTSLIFAFASYYDLAVCTLSLSDFESDRQFQKAVMGMPDKAALVIEDIDSFFKGRETVSEKPAFLSFSGLLNALGGLAVKEGRVLFVTTNKPEDIDPALTRAGRLDKSFLLSYADAYQVRRLFLQVFPNAVSQADSFAETVAEMNLSPAKLVDYLFTNKSSLSDTLRLTHRLSAGG